MSVEDLSFTLRDLLHRISTRGDEKALRELLKIVLEIILEKNDSKLTWLMQIIHDEKTYVLTDTEIMPEKTLELLEQAALYHAVYELIRSVRQGLECKILDVDQLRGKIEEGNLSDLTEEIARTLKCVIEGRQVEEILSRVRRLAEEIKLPEKYSRPPDLRPHLCKYILSSTAKLIELLADLKVNEQKKS